MHHHVKDNHGKCLTSLEGLKNLTIDPGGFLAISGNDGLTNLVGLHNITTPGAIYIRENDGLTSLVGLNNLTTADGIDITGNLALVSITDLSNLSAAGIFSRVSDNPLLDCSLPPQPGFLPVDVSTGNLVDCPVK